MVPMADANASKVLEAIDEPMQNLQGGEHRPTANAGSRVETRMQIECMGYA